MGFLINMLDSDGNTQLLISIFPIHCQNICQYAYSFNLSQLHV